MASQQMVSFLQLIFVATVVLFSVFLNKLYNARSFVRQLQRQGFVSEPPPPLTLIAKRNIFQSLCLRIIGYLAM